MGTTSNRPRIRALTPEECELLLARNNVGRMAFSFGDRVDIQPVHYVYEAGWVYGRTSEGAKLDTLARNQWVAFEVDEVRGVLDWGSVVARGSFHRIDPNGAPSQRDAAVHAVELLRTIVPETFTADDPVEFRTVLFRISVGAVTGRLATPGDLDDPRGGSVRAAGAASGTVER
jgi:uncharacterized protein